MSKVKKVMIVLMSVFCLGLLGAGAFVLSGCDSPALVESGGGIPKLTI